MQMGWLLPRKLEPGWMAVSLQATEFSIAHGRREPGVRPLVSQIASYPIEAGRADAAGQVSLRDVDVRRRIPVADRGSTQRPARGTQSSNPLERAGSDRLSYR